MAVNPSTSSTVSLIDWWPHVTAAIGAVACICFGVVDVWHFHALPSTTDLGLFFLGVGALGVTGAYVAGTTK